MVALALNGWTIPVGDGGCTQSELEIGTLARAFSGKVRRNRRSIKRMWAISSAPMQYGHAVALEGLLLGRGEQWPGDADLYSAKGLPPYQDNGASLVTGGGKYGNAIWPRGATSNLLTSNQATGTDTSNATTGFRKARSGQAYGDTSGTATLASSTAQAWEGSRSLLVTCGAFSAGQGAALNVSVSPNTLYTFSVYVKANGSNINLVVGIVDQNSQTPWTTVGGPTVYSSGTATNVTTAAGWVRLTRTFATRSTTTAVDIVVGENTDSNWSWYMDGLQLETGGAASAFVATPFAGVNLAYDVSSHLAQAAEAVTVAGWLINPGSGTPCAWVLADSGYTSNRVSLTYASGSLQAQSGLVPGSPVTAAWATPSTYAHVAVIMQPKTGAMSLYVGGVLVASSTSSLGALSIPTLARLWMGNANGANQWQGYLDEVVLLPYAAHDAQIAAMAAMTITPPLQPNLVASGDLVGGVPLYVVASDVKATYLGAVKAGAWRSNMGKVDFTISEV